jgi:hypothetical protein
MFQFDNLTDGPEHIVHIDGVTGSSPVQTTTRKPLKNQGFFFMPLSEYSMYTLWYIRSVHIENRVASLAGTSLRFNKVDVNGMMDGDLLRPFWWRACGDLAMQEDCSLLSPI